MTKEELVEVVARAHGLFNQTGFTPKELKAIHEAWWTMLGEFEVADVMKALKQRAIESDFPARPGEIYRRLKAAGTPEPMEAWLAYRRACEAAHHGDADAVVALHPAIRSVIHLLGDGLHTNGDREQFVNAYEKARLAD